MKVEGSDFDIPCQVAGGLRTAQHARQAIEAGADRVVLGSALIADPSLAAALVAAHGPERIVAAVDVRDGRALGSGVQRAAQAGRKTGRATPSAMPRRAA